MRMDRNILELLRRKESIESFFLFVVDLYFCVAVLPLLLTVLCV